MKRTYSLRLKYQGPLDNGFKKNHIRYNNVVLVTICLQLDVIVLFYHQ